MGVVRTIRKVFVYFPRILFSYIFVPFPEQSYIQGDSGGKISTVGG
jgi:hypothetical protein